MISLKMCAPALIAAMLATGAALSIAPVLAAGPVASEWYDGFNNRSRLVAGTAERNGVSGLYAALVVSMPEGWKTYWRYPGEAGGVPPEFDWQSSENLADVKVLYPAPRRIPSRSGDVAGYEDEVAFPVLLTPKDKGAPVKLHGKFAYGVCKDLCVPAEAELQLEIPPGVGASNEISQALNRVPNATPRPGIDPALAAWRIEDIAGKPTLVFSATSANAAELQAFVEPPLGLYLALPKKAESKNGTANFTLDLTDGVELKDLKGKPLSVTLVDGKGQSETTIKLE